MELMKLAADIELSPTGDTFTRLPNFTIGGMISTGITIALIAAALIFFFMLVFGGIKYITSGGDKGKAEAARGMITAALIGLVIVFSAWAIATLIGTVFGVQIFGDNGIAIPTIPEGGSGITN